MFEVRGGRGIGGDDCPAVAEGLRPVVAEIHHRFDGEGHAGLDLLAGIAAAEVRNLRLLVHRGADSVADHVADDAEAVGFDEGLHRMRNVADTVADLGLLDAEVEGFFADLQKFGDARGNAAQRDGEGVVTDVATGVPCELLAWLASLAAGITAVVLAGVESAKGMVVNE